MKLIKRILLVALCLCVFGGAAGTFVALKSLPPECTAERKIVHVSIDDCARALARLRDPAVKSIYDDPFFSQLREWHEEFGAKFTCYVYGEIAGFSLSEVPTKFREEFSAASSWLKFGFHAPSSDIEKTRAQTAEEFAENFSRVNEAIDVFAGTNARSTVLRLDYFFAREEWMPAIYSAGTRHLLGPDTAGRKAYALDEAASEELWTHGALPFDRNEQMGGGISARMPDSRKIFCRGGRWKTFGIKNESSFLRTSGQCPQKSDFSWDFRSVGFVTTATNSLF